MIKRAAERRYVLRRIFDRKEGKSVRVAVIGSRNIKAIDLSKYLPEGTDELVSGGARGVDTVAREYARSAGLPITEFLPEYDKYGKGAPLVRNVSIIEYADIVLAFWDGKSRGTRFVIDKCKKLGKEVRIFMAEQ